MTKFQFISNLLKLKNELLEIGVNSYNTNKLRPKVNALFDEFERQEHTSCEETSREELALFNEQITLLVVNLCANVDGEGYHFYFIFLSLLNEILMIPGHEADFATLRFELNALFDEFEHPVDTPPTSRADLASFNILADHLIINLIATLDNESYHFCLKEKKQGESVLSEEEFLDKVSEATHVPHNLHNLLTFWASNSSFTKFQVDDLFNICDEAHETQLLLALEEYNGPEHGRFLKDLSPEELELKIADACDSYQQENQDKKMEKLITALDEYIDAEREKHPERFVDGGKIQ